MSAAKAHDRNAIQKDNQNNERNHQRHVLIFLLRMPVAFGQLLLAFFHFKAAHEIEHQQQKDGK